MPARGLSQFETCPIFQASEAFMQPEPMPPAVFDGMLRVSVDPVLERVDTGNPGKYVDHSFEMLLPGTLEIFAVWVELFELLATQQFHAHRGDFAEFDRRMAIVSQRLITGRVDMECMAGFMEERANITIQSNRVHKNERQAGLG